jgi:tetratricopeptide (TPR) repeat protein
VSKLRRVHALAFALLLFVNSVAVLSDEISQIENEVKAIHEQAGVLDTQYLKHGEFKGEQYVVERLIDGENFYRIKDYQRAAIIFMDIIANYSHNLAYADALFLYADSLFLAGDYLGAREWFRRVVDESGKPGIARFRQRAIERLIEIAIYLGDFKGIEKYYDQLDQELTPHAYYVKGKYLYFKGDLESAGQVFSLVTGDQLLRLKALYLLGVVWTRQEEYQKAIEVFEKAQEFTPNNKDEQDLIDLMNLGAGRLYYEQDLIEPASACYDRISPNSVYFDAALYEAASVRVRIGDTVQAEQTLEVLTVTIPDSKFIPRAKMLRGNLLLRTGRYAEAEKVFNEVISEFTPVMDQLDGVMAAQHDTRRFFFELVERSVSTLDVASVLPPLVVKWVGEEPNVQRALTLAGDLGAAREHVHETEKLIHLTEAVIDGPSPINAIPILRQATRRSQQLSNRLTQQRNLLVRIGQSKLGKANPKFKVIDQQRRKLANRLAELPTTNADFERRERESKKQFERMRKELSRQLIRIDQIGAKVVAIDRYISDARYTQGASEESLAAIRSELSRYQHEAIGMRQELENLRNDIDTALYQVGIGDIGDSRDRELAVQIGDLSEQERKLIAKSDSPVGRRMEKVYEVIDSTEAILLDFSKEVEQEAAVRVGKMRQQVGAEKNQVAAYRKQLVMLSEEAEEVVGGVAFENFLNVRNRFYDLVLKADVGIIDVVWLLKEEHTNRITNLSKARVDEIKRLDEKFHEVKTGP